MSKLDEAIEDVAAAISTKSKENKCTPPELEQLAHAASMLKFGSQGLTDYRYAATYDQTYTSDQHETHHQSSEHRDPPGFSGPRGLRTSDG